MQTYRIDPGFINKLRTFPMGSTLSLAALAALIGGLVFIGAELPTTLTLGAVAALGTVSLIRDLKRKRSLADTLRHHALTVGAGQLHFSGNGTESIVDVAAVKRALLQQKRGRVESIILQIDHGGMIKLENYENMDRLAGAMEVLLHGKTETKKWWTLHF